MTPNPQAKGTSFGDRKILRNAIIDSFWKLDPRLMVKNPVMFVVEVGAVITLIVLVSNLVQHHGEFRFGLQITLWLWFTVLFANFAEAMAEGRGKAQADTLRKARAETEARKLREDGTTELLPSSKLRSGHVVLVAAGGGGVRSEGGGGAMAGGGRRAKKYENPRGIPFLSFGNRAATARP